MNIVRFPGLNLDLKIPQIAGNIFGIDIYMYAICIVIGILVLIILCKNSKEKFENNFDVVLNIGTISLIFGILGARLYFILFNLDYYLNNIIEIFNFRDGGLAIYGGLITGILTAYIICKIKKIDILNLLDYVIPFIALAQGIGRWGNFFNIEAYGSNTNIFLRMGIYTQTGYIEVHPVFLYESICDILIFLILRKLQKNRKFKGEIFFLYCILYSGIRFFIEGLRIDSLMIYNFRISQILSLFIFIISIIIFYKNIKDIKKDKTNKQEKKQNEKK